MNKIIETIYKRRSTRSYLTAQLEEAHLEDILLAGRHAPSGGNNQTSHFLVIQNKETLEALKALVLAEFAKMEVTEGMYKSLASSIAQSKSGKYDFSFAAPTLIVVANKKEYGNAMADSAVAIENMMIAAASLQVGSCWINQLHWLSENPAVRSFLEELGLAADEAVCGSVALGYPAKEIPAPLPRKGNRVTYIR
ncbi:MAG: nitroreductase family protein [Christensenellaceae bacterium]|jgi:nitroreductase